MNAVRIRLFLTFDLLGCGDVELSFEDAPVSSAGEVSSA